MKRLWWLFPVLIWGQEDFISHYEYGEMLYANPRGISCSQCHGDNGEGKTIVSYRDEEGKQVLRGADIRQKSIEEMTSALRAYHLVMPRYYLTKEEIKAIYDYLQKKNKAKALEEAQRDEVE